MVSEKDVYVSANILIKQCGDGTEKYAIDMIENKSDDTLWRRVLKTIKVLKNVREDVLN